ncbi:hypothetical protein [Streptomyces zaomyceticus]|uniref:hypothetical protein n=1 Tax=Streptomyces zaomyceticus TaxID=68286 RepID=UPI00324B916A
MTPGRHTPDPREARTPAEFLALLQTLKDWSGLTYRELSARAETRGEVLPRSTVANMLARPTLPREELLTVFVRACGVAPGELAGWLEVRRELAGRGPYPPADPADGDPARADPACADPADRDPAEGDAEEADAARPDPAGADRADADPVDADPVADRPAAAEPSGASGTTGAAGPGLSWPVVPAAPSGGPPRPRSETPSRIRRAVVAAVAVTGLVLAGFSVVAFLRDGRTGPAGQPPRTSAPETSAPETSAPETSGAAPTAPAAGDVRIRVMGTDLCLAERRGTRTGQIHQVPCAEAVVPLYSLAAVGAGRWRIVSDHPDFGPGCSGIPSGGRIPDAAYEDSECGDGGRIEAFALEPYGPGGPVRGYRIVPVGSGTPGSCVTVVGDREAVWARLAQAPCVPDAAGQLFSFDRRGPASPGTP